MEVVYHKTAFKLSELPLTKIHVIDDWCPQELWYNFENKISKSNRWSFDNDVTYKDGVTTEITWAIWLYGRWMKPLNDQSEIADPIIQKLCDDFGVQYDQFEFSGINGQTRGLQGSVHVDAYRKKNISFLWHLNTEWKPEWGGAFRVFKLDTIDQGHRGFSQELIDNWQIAEIEYKPNRVIIMDGRYPHSADAPTDESGYTLRKTMVVRGEVAKLTHDSN